MEVNWLCSLYYLEKENGMNIILLKEGGMDCDFSR